MKYQSLKSRLMGGIAIAALASSSAYAANFDIPGGDLAPALDAYQAQSGIPVVVAANAVKNVKTHGVRGDLPAQAALTKILKGTGFVATPGLSGVMEIVPAHKKTSQGEAPVTRLAEKAIAPAHAAASVETVVVTSSKIKGDIQTVPIAITALSQEQLTERQIAGGPDLVKEVPNLTFTKTNFTGYSIAIRGIGTEAVSVTTDPAVAVAFNDTPFLRNHFFEQEFFDVAQVQVLRGPQGTLFGRNANAGVVNIESAKPTDHFEAMLSADWGNFSNRRYEGMVNIPIVQDKLALRVAGEWTKRDGYAYNEITGDQIDGRDLWTTRATLRWKPGSRFTADFIWEHFQEGDDRLRSGKQLCKTDPGPSSFTYDNGIDPPVVVNVPKATDTVYTASSANFSQGCLPDSLYDKGDPANGDYGAFGVPNGFSLPYVSGLAFIGYLSGGRGGDAFNPYLNAYQSTNLRHIQSSVPPHYIANSDTLEFNTEWNITPSLTFNSETGYNRDFLWSQEDFSRFETRPGIFEPHGGAFANGNYNCGDGYYAIGMTCSAAGHGTAPGSQAATFCDPQLGCSDRLVLEDLSTERSWQFSQEFRLASDFKGPFNFSAGGNYLHYETTDKFYVFSNALTLIASTSNIELLGCPYPDGWISGVTTGLECIDNGQGRPKKLLGGLPSNSPTYVDPNPITNVNDNGRNYFLSKNPYTLNSYALFGEAYYNLTKDLKLTGGLRWTDDEKHFPEFPSQLVIPGYGVYQVGQIDQSWKKFSGRAVVNWQPQLDFTDQTMIYASYSHGYKAGGANPPPAVVATNGGAQPYTLHPLTFDPEYIDAYELGTKNTALDGDLIFNADAFYYDYKGYQISQIVDRTSININVDAKIWGAELQTTYSPLPGLKFTFNGGYEDTRIKNDQAFIDLMDRTYGHHDTWTIMKPWVGEASNCVFPDYVAAALIIAYAGAGEGSAVTQSCGIAYNYGQDPVPSARAPSWYPGYDPESVSNGPLGGANNGQGFAKPVGGNELPNAPHFTVSLTGEYTMPVSDNWAATLHTDFYWQSQSFARIFNDHPYDKIRGYSNVNAALILSDATGWQVMGYVKNIFDTTAITGDFLYTDDVGLTTNIFLTDPRLYGVRVTKHFDGGDDSGGGFSLFSGDDGKKPQLWLTLGGNFNAVLQADTKPYAPIFESVMPADLPTPSSLQKSPSAGFDWEASLTFQPQDSDWRLKGDIRYGRSSRNGFTHKSGPFVTRAGFTHASSKYSVYYNCKTGTTLYGKPVSQEPGCVAWDRTFIDQHSGSSEQHMIADFNVGHEVGIGLFGRAGTGTVSAGVRIAQFDSRSGMIAGADTKVNFPVTTIYPAPYVLYHNVYQTTEHERRSFHGMGPELNWDASQPVWGSEEDGQIAIDWGVNAGILFGEQNMSRTESTLYCHANGTGAGTAQNCRNATTTTDPASRSSRVTVPNLGGYIGASMQYRNAKLSFGYRADEYFNAMDGGQDVAKRYNRGFSGPYMNVSIGLGG